jgi:hypothetical protein
MNALEKLIARKGTYVVNDTVEYVKDCVGYYVTEPTVIARIEVDGVTATDEKDNYIAVSATSVKGGVLLTPLDSEGHTVFSAITLTSGSIIAIHA